jgi:hypothetical protein
MRHLRFGVLGSAWLLTACATPASQSAHAAEAAADPGQVTGPLHVTLLGDYVGKHLRIQIDEAVVVDERLSFSPAGAEHRYTVAHGPARSAPVRVQIEGCDGPWTGTVRLEPTASAHILIQGCDVQALAPD